MKIQSISNEILSFIEGNAFLKENFKHLYIIGNHSSRQDAEFSEIDYVLILDSESSQIDSIFEISNLLTKLTISTQKLISVFPLHERDYSEKNSMFIKNLWSHGIKIR